MHFKQHDLFTSIQQCEDIKFDFVSPYVGKFIRWQFFTNKTFVEERNMLLKETDITCDINASRIISSSPESITVIKDLGNDLSTNGKLD